jgi:hypothetical protein
MTQLGGAVFSDTFTGGIFGINNHCFFLTSSRPFISVSASGMCHLLAIAINGILNEIGPSVTTSLCADDIAIYYSSWSIATIERRLEGSFEPSGTVGSGEWIFLLPR